MTSFPNPPIAPPDIAPGEALRLNADGDGWEVFTPAGSSGQTGPVWLAPVDWIFLNNTNTSFAIDPYIYDNGTDGVGATTTQVTPADGVLTVDGGTPAPGDSVAFVDFASPANSGLYVVTATGDGATVPWVLTRRSDNDTTASLAQSWGALVAPTGTGAAFGPGAQVGVASWDAGFTIGGSNVNINVAAPSAVAQGGGAAVGRGTIAIGANCVATIFNGFAVGLAAKATGDDTVAIGDDASASGRGSTAIGTHAVASGSNAVALNVGANAISDAAVALGNSSVASGVSSVASGALSLAYEDAQIVDASQGQDNRSQVGGSQSGRIGALALTTDATPTPAGPIGRLIRFVDQNAAPVWNRTVKIRSFSIVARRTDVPGTDASWNLAAPAVVRGDGVSAYTWIGGSAPTLTLGAHDTAAAGWTVTVAIAPDPDSSGAAALIVTVTGEVGNSISWWAVAELDEVAG